MKNLKIKIVGLSCEGCVKNVSDVLRALPGVAEVSVALASGTAEITYDPQRIALPRFKEAIEGAGFNVDCRGCRTS